MVDHTAISKSEVDANQRAIDEMRRIRGDVGYVRANHSTDWAVQPGIISRPRRIADKRHIGHRDVMQPLRPAISQAGGITRLDESGRECHTGIIRWKQGGIGWSRASII